MSKVKDLLYTARWALTEALEKDKYGMLGTAVDRIAEAQALLADDEIPEPSDDTSMAPPFVEPPKLGALVPTKNWKPTVVVVKGVRFKNRGKYAAGGPLGSIVHYTVSGSSAASAISIVKYLAKVGYGCPVVDENGIIYVPEGFDWETDIGVHAGNSKWNGQTSLNNKYIGFELCNWGSDGKKRGAKNLRTISKDTANIYKGTYEKYTPAQEQFLLDVNLYLARKYPKTFKLENVAGHDEVRALWGQPGGKQDPGGSLSMTMPQFRELLKKA